MPEVGLDRAQVERRRTATGRAQDSPDRPGLDGVADGGPGPVGLDVGDLVRADAGLPVGLAQHGLLGGAAGHGHPGGPPVLIQNGREDQAVDPVPAPLRLAEGDQQGHGRPLAPHVAVGVIAEGPALAVGREVAALAEAQARLGAQDQVDPAREGLLGAPVPDRAAGQVERDQRRGAGRVDHGARAAEVEQEGDAVGDDAPRHAGVAGRADLRPLGLDRPVVVAPGAHEHRRARPCQGAERQARVLDRLVARLEDQPLLRIHAERFFGGDPEEARVELRHLREEAAACGLEVPALAEVGVIQPFGVPALRRHGHDPRAPLAEEGFEVRQGRDAAGQAAADADDR